MKISRYPLNYGMPARIDLRLPRGAKILSTAYDDHAICLFVEEDPDQIGYDTRTIRLLETDDEIPHRMQFIGTVVSLGGSFTLHVFED